ncbi:MAG: SBBP repeat-containing protein, partial [Bryobacteraceae bacterium]
TSGVLRPEYGGGDTDAFVVKLNSDGAAAFSTYLGGNGAEIGNGIAADGFGNVYVAGATSSTDFPRSTGAPEFRGGERDGFLTRLNPNASEVQFSNFIGGGGDDDLFGVVVDSSGLASIVGSTTSGNLPVTPDAIQSTRGGEIDVLFAQVATSAPGSIRYMTYLGGPGLDDGFAMTADATGNVYLTGAVDPGFPTTSGAGQTDFGGGNGDAFVAKIAPETGDVQPTFTAESVVNAATFQGGPVAPGELVTIFGTDIGPAQLVGLELNDRGFVSDTLGATRVLFDGVPAPLIYASQTQTTAVVPYAVAGKSTTSVQIAHRGVTSQAVTLSVTATAPGIFTNASSGTGQGAILNQDGSRNLPESPAEAGTIVSIFATGGGVTDPPTETGSVPASLPFPRLAQPTQVRIGGIEAEVSYSGVAPGLVSGVIQVNARVPANAPRGAAVPVELFVGGAGGRSGVTMAIR